MSMRELESTYLSTLTARSPYSLYGPFQIRRSSPSTLRIRLLDKLRRTTRGGMNMDRWLGCIQLKAVWSFLSLQTSYSPATTGPLEQQNLEKQANRGMRRRLARSFTQQRLASQVLERPRENLWRDVRASSHPSDIGHHS